jgi:hypothetical protein
MGAVRLALVQIEDLLRGAVQAGEPLPPPPAPFVAGLDLYNFNCFI